MTCALGPALPPDVCRHLDAHDRYFSAERCYIRERPLDLGTDAGWRAVAAFNRRRADVCRRALTGRWGSHSFCAGGALAAWLRDQPVPLCAS